MANNGLTSRYCSDILGNIYLIGTNKFMKWIRTCQSCGNEQEDKEPKQQGEFTIAYENRKCKKCKSESLDYGSSRPSTEQEIEQALKDTEND